LGSMSEQGSGEGPREYMFWSLVIFCSDRAHCTFEHTRSFIWSFLLSIFHLPVLSSIHMLYVTKLIEIQVHSMRYFLWLIPSCLLWGDIVQVNGIISPSSLWGYRTSCSYICSTSQSSALKY
jgi:hypothetical protein